MEISLCAKFQAPHLLCFPKIFTFTGENQWCSPFEGLSSTGSIQSHMLFIRLFNLWEDSFYCTLLRDLKKIPWAVCWAWYPHPDGWGLGQRGQPEQRRRESWAGWLRRATSGESPARDVGSPSAALQSPSQTACKGDNQNHITACPGNMHNHL